ncbi:uncharacterized protein EV422DRAFT_138449 [Fimicolochytrium jonesii]|uniref:uncharacterized protein n=1 Tax=Fimicolochytrium jonesii TaxID=1396493 RepID=UPI0022FEBDD2|nr:uncharacterized protein EV422DRAFT_138449 [Fimicolochytrium jonesii]KAI8825724.1 hypothetical protein EV422DRAFT_138449 [Fimicolochytrium jonesii]
MDVESTTSLTLLDRLLTLLTTYHTTHDRTTSLLDSLANLQSQRNDTIPLLGATSPSTSGDRWWNSVTTPLIVHEFPDLVERLLGKQTVAIEHTLKRLHDEMRGFEKVVGAMDSLQRDAVFKLHEHIASAPNMTQAPPPHPAHITLLETVSWIDEFHTHLQREVGAKREMLRGLKFEMEGGNLQGVRDRWGLQSGWEMDREDEVRERVGLMKANRRLTG